MGRDWVRLQKMSWVWNVCQPLDWEFGIHLSDLGGGGGGGGLCQRERVGCDIRVDSKFIKVGVGGLK